MAEIKDLALALIFRDRGRNRTRLRSLAREQENGVQDAGLQASLLERIRSNEYPIDDQAK